MLTLILTTALTSCQTNKRKTDITPIQLDVKFPSPYDEQGNIVVTINDDKTVSMPLWYWLKIVEYQIDVETNIELMN